MVKYVFGVCSSKYSLESDDFLLAKLAMVLFMNTSAPIAIYEPSGTVISPLRFLQDAPHLVDTENLRQIMKSIRNEMEEERGS